MFARLLLSIVFGFIDSDIQSFARLGLSSAILISSIILSTFSIIIVKMSVRVPWFSRSLWVKLGERNRFGVMITAKLYVVIKFYS